MQSLTNEELAETANVLLAQVDREDLRIVYAGNGWFHRFTTRIGGHAFKERRKDVEQSIRRLHERIAREEFERPEKERRQREAEAQERLWNAAPAMLAALQAVSMHATCNGSLRKIVLAAIAKATEGPLDDDE